MRSKWTVKVGKDRVKKLQEEEGGNSLSYMLMACSVKHRDIIMQEFAHRTAINLTAGNLGRAHYLIRGERFFFPLNVSWR